MIARKPRSRSRALARVSVAAGLIGASSGCNPKLTSAPSPAVAAITQIRCGGAITSASRPQPIAPTMKAAEPHSRSGP